MKKVFVYIVIFILLQSCIIVGIGKKYTWDYNKVWYSDGIGYTDKPGISIKIENATKELILPFMFIDYRTKKINLNFESYTFQKIYSSLDSAIITVESDSNQFIYRTKIQLNNITRYYTLREQSSNTNISYFIKSGKIILPKLFKYNNIKLSINLFLTKTTNEQIRYDYNFPILLKLEDEKRFQIGFFQV